ncbi:MAG: sigma-70 family RNA polymerase sigma factor [Chthoniobacter sp.]|uniref:RNA polymerase sigma factor n=1 Tax=Chthoniobacter sp. TaxID=2510640 RepID=UPI0032AA23C6
MEHAEILSQLEALHRDAFGWAVSCCAGDWHRGEDVLQVAYVKAVHGSARFDGRSAFKTWWFGVIRFTALEEARRARRWFAFLDRWRAEPEAPDEASPIVEDSELAALAIALRALSERQREVLHLTFYQRLSLSEAADVMQVTVGSARQHYERGKKRLREILPNRSALHE